MSLQASATSSAFIWRRVHSLTGLWLVLYLIIHLVTNSQAALWIGEDGVGFIRLVNLLESLPYLVLIETFLIGVPFLLHIIWGIKRALDAKFNPWPNQGKNPSLGYLRNWNYTLQRLSSWILLVGVIGHVIQMRFLHVPTEVPSTIGTQYFVKLRFDEGLYTLAARLGVTLLTTKDQAAARLLLQQSSFPPASFEERKTYNEEERVKRVMYQNLQEDRIWLETFTQQSLHADQVLAMAPKPGTAFLLMVRDIFKSPFYAVLYTIFVIASAFHAFNGFWTFLLTWGLILSYRSQNRLFPIGVIGMIGLTLLGCAAIWCSYWVNLRT